MGAHQRIMPPEAPPHPAARAVGDARRSGSPAGEKTSHREPAVAGELLGVSSLARVVAGEASLADVGALSWMMLRQMVPCAAMGIFVPEERDDSIRGVYAAGAHAPLIRDLRSVPGTGVVGWCAANRRMAMNAEPALDYGHHVTELDPPLLSMVAVPLMHEGSVAALIALYATTKNAFTEDQGRLLELLAPTLATSLAIVQAEHQSEAPLVQPRRSRTADLHVLRRTANS
jgi:GAF domain-containing protein